MSLHRRGALARLGLALLTPSLALGTAWAADAAWPSQPIRVVVPFTAGSGTDVVARAVAERLDKRLGQPLVVDNKPGAGGTLGASQVATAPANGYTLLVHSSGHVANAALYPQLRYDTAKDFKPIAMLATLPNVLVVAPASGIKTVADLVAKAKAQPGKLTYASAGNGSATHINAEKFRLAAGLDAVHVPYRGTPEALVGVMGGLVDAFFAPLVSAMPLIKSGKLVPLAVGSEHRSSALPQVPTTQEAGFPGSAYIFWVGLFAPAKTPPAIVERLQRETAEVLRQPEIKARLDTLGAELPTVDAQQFAAQVASEITSTAKLIRDAGIKVE
jgi:tripartite-type tricarboxylate transporter receptor subunit TctC